MRYFTIPNFLTKEECNALIALARSRLVEAGGFQVASGTTEYSDYRKTQICWFSRSENSIIRKIESKVQDITKMPLANYEGVQYGKYTKGGHYTGHYDFCDPKWGEGAKNFLARGGQRVITCLIYLNTLPEGVGGETVFMDHDPPLVFRPIQGKALFFYNVVTNVDEQGIPHFAELDYTAKHEATEIIADNVQKHIATQWVREREFI